MEVKISFFFLQFSSLTRICQGIEWFVCHFPGPRFAFSPILFEIHLLVLYFYIGLYISIPGLQTVTSDNRHLFSPRSGGQNSEARCWQGWFLLCTLREHPFMPRSLHVEVTGNPWSSLSSRGVTLPVPVLPPPSSLCVFMWLPHEDTSHWI